MIGSGHNVLITGIGGGVALMALQFALASGATVYCTSGKQEKLDKAIALGASGGALYNQEDWSKQLKVLVPSGFDCIIDSAGGSQWNELTGLMKAGGRLIFYGATNGNVPNLSLQKLFWKQITICGSTMGSDAEFEMMLHFCKHHGIIPVIDSIFTLNDAPSAFEYMDSGQQFGKIVLNHGQSAS